jgi:GTPase SAR1 family protein
MVKARTKTTGVVEINFELRGLTYNVIDVGGQRSERRKWIKCFEDVDAILFVSSLTSFCSVLYEDESENRLEESTKVFMDVAAMPCFKNTPIFLWLTKVDLFQQLILKTAMSERVYGFTGKDFDYDSGMNFIKQKFSNAFSELQPGKMLRINTVSALDSKQVVDAWKQVQKWL